MRVEKIVLTTYILTAEEVDWLVEAKLYGLLLSRLTKNERIEIE